MNERALYLAIRLISKLQELKGVHLEAGSVSYERIAQVSDVTAGVLRDEEGITDPISVQLVLAAMPECDPLNPPTKEAVQQFADFLENQLHLSDTPRE
jgi:hypothetical protein